MIRLGNAAIYYAVLKCIERSNYRIVIAVSKHSTIQGVFNSCMDVIEKFDFDRPKCKCSGSQFTMEFNNGSVIKGIYASTSARGHAAHLVIDDYGIDDDTRNFVLRPIEKMEE